MGQKIHPYGFRLGVIYDWKSRWFAEGREYTELLHEDLQIRKLIKDRNPNAAISKVEIERTANNVEVIVWTARPGMIIGRGGRGIEELRRILQEKFGRNFHIQVKEVEIPELDAQLVAENIAFQIERRVSYRRAMRQAAERAMLAGAKGVRIQVKGRLGGAEMARKEWTLQGRVPLQTLRADIDYGFAEAVTKWGKIGVKVWIYKGDVLPEREKVEEVAAEEETPAPEGATVAEEAGPEVEGQPQPAEG